MRRRLGAQLVEKSLEGYSDGLDIPGFESHRGEEDETRGEVCSRSLKVHNCLSLAPKP